MRLYVVYFCLLFCLGASAGQFLVTTIFATPDCTGPALEIMATSSEKIVCVDSGVPQFGYILTYCPNTGSTPKIAFCLNDTSCGSCQPPTDYSYPCQPVPGIAGAYAQLVCEPEAPVAPPGSYVLSAFGAAACVSAALVEAKIFPYACYQLGTTYQHALCSGSDTPSYEECTDPLCQQNCVASQGPVGCMVNQTTGYAVSFACGVANNSTTTTASTITSGSSTITMATSATSSTGGTSSSTTRGSSTGTTGGAEISSLVAWPLALLAVMASVL